MRTTRQLPLNKCRRAADACACFNLRKTSRAVTALFDDALRPFGIRSGQFALLLTIRIHEKSTLHELARAVWVERSALGRTLRPLEEMNLIEILPGEDRRTRLVSLTEAGHQILADAFPAWEKTQKRLAQQLGREQLNQLLSTLSLSFDRIAGHTESLAS